MIWLPVLLLAPLAAMKVRASMAGACRRSDRYETREEALEAINMSERLEVFINQLGSVPVSSRCADCDGFHAWPYRVPDWS